MKRNIESNNAIQDDTNWVVPQPDRPAPRRKVTRFDLQAYLIVLRNRIVTQTKRRKRCYKSRIRN